MKTPLGLLTAVIGSRELAETAIRELMAAGYVCVPAKPTEKMLADAFASIHDEDGTSAWADMVESALATQAAETLEL